MLMEQVRVVLQWTKTEQGVVEEAGVDGDGLVVAGNGTGVGEGVV